MELAKREQYLVGYIHQHLIWYRSGYVVFYGICNGIELCWYNKLVSGIIKCLMMKSLLVVHMKLNFVLASLFLMLNSNFAQTGFPGYYKYLELTQSADKLYQAEQYEKAGKLYLMAAKTSVEKGIVVPMSDLYYHAAISLALAKKSKDSFECLFFLANKLGFHDLDQLIEEPNFNTLRKEIKWNELINLVKINKSESDRIKLIVDQRTILLKDTNEVIFYPLTSFAKNFIEQDSFPFISLNHENFRIFFSADSYAAEQLAALKQELSDAYCGAIHILGAGQYHRGINIVLFNSAEELKQSTGIRAQGGVAYPDHDIAFFPYHKKRRPQFKHEIFHIISNQLWGNTQSRLLNEGSAVYADNQCYVDNPIYAVNAWFMDRNLIVPFKSLVEDFDKKAIENDVIAYIQSAGIFKYLYEKYGLTKMRKLWVEGFEQFETIYGLKLEDLEIEWLNFVKSIPVPVEIDQKNILQNGCG